MFFPLEIFVEVDFSCFQSVFQTEREREREREGGEREGERERVRFNTFCGYPLSLRCF